MLILERALRWVVIAGVFALPFVCLIVSTSLFFPFITGKNFAFRIIVEIIAGAWLALALYKEEYRPRRTWILGALALFVLAMAIANAQGLNPGKSFWSNYERMDGWVTIAHLLAYVAVAASVLRTEKLWRRLFQTSLGVSVYVALYGLLQVAGVTALGQGGAAGLSARVDATFGNPIYLAVYMLFHVFIAALLWAREWQERGHDRRLSTSLLYGAVIALNSLVLLFTGTRGTTIGLVGGTLVAAALMVFSAWNSRGAWRGAAAAIAAIIVLIGGFWSVRESSFVQSVGFLQRLATISTQDATVKARFLNWGMAWEGVKERPVFGWGQENYAIVFNKYYDPRMYGQEPWFDRVHNIVFDWLVAGGFVGFAAYVSIFLAALWALWRGPRQGERPAFSPAERSILTGLLAGYTCHNFFVFDNVTSYILFGTVLAFIIYRSADARGAAPLPRGDILPRGTFPYAAVAVAVLTWGTASFVNSDALAANRALLQGLAPQQGGAVKNLEFFKEAIALDTYGNQEAREQLAQIAAQVAQNASAPNDLKQQFYQTAVAEMEKQSQVSPLDARFPLFLGIVHEGYGAYDSALAAYQRAHELSPRKQTILFQLAQNALARGRNAEALGYMKEAHEFAPEIRDVRLMYAAIAIRAGDSALAQSLLDPLIASGEAADQRILGAYVAAKNYQRPIAIWRARIAAQPEDTQAYFTLAALHYAAGERTNAVSVLRSAAEKFPEIAMQATALIADIQSGTAQLQ